MSVERQLVERIENKTKNWL